MSPEIVYLVAGATAGGFVNGLAGFGTALFAMGFFLTVMAPLEAVAVTVTIAVTTGLQGLWLVRHSLGHHPARLLRLLLPAALGLPVGVALLGLLEPRDLKLIVAGVLILYGGYFSVRKSLPQFSRPYRAIDVVVGFAAGIMGGAAALSGALPTMWCALRGWPKSETRAVLQPFNMSILAGTALLLALNGAFDRDTLGRLAIAIPVSMIAARLGIIAFGRLDDVTFRRLIIGLCLVSGSILLLRELL